MTTQQPTRPTTDTSTEVPRGTVKVHPWPEFEAMFAANHKQGEHVSVVGPTGSGKSVLLLKLAEIAGRKKDKHGRPSSVTVLGTKPRDDTLSLFMATTDFKQVKRWPPSYGEEHAVVWVRGGSPEQEITKQKAVFKPLLNAVYQEGGQTVVIDEAAYMEDELSLRTTLNKFWQGARSNKTSVFAATQRPRHVSRLMWSEPSWVIIFLPEDLDDMKRVAEASGRKNEVLLLASRLGGYEFLCVRRQRAGQRGLYVSRVDIQSPTKKDSKRA